MNHKHLLSCCVEILDSFNPRIHGVLEHLNSCLATKQVSKVSVIYIETSQSLQNVCRHNVLNVSTWFSSQGLEESDESFITEVFSGCVQYSNILKVCFMYKT